VILYTITLTNPLAPKTATVRETQVSRRGKRQIIVGWEVLFLHRVKAWFSPKLVASR
jgi:hypothetical protein